MISQSPEISIISGVFFYHLEPPSAAAATSSAALSSIVLLCLELLLFGKMRIAKFQGRFIFKLLANHFVSESFLFPGHVFLSFPVEPS